MQKSVKGNEDSKKKALEILAEGEKKRAKLRFDKGMSEIENGNFATLKNPEFQNQFKDYLLTSFTSSENEKITRVLKTCFRKLKEKKDDRVIFFFIENLSTETLESCKVGLMSFLCEELSEVYSGKDKYGFATRRTGRFFAHSAVFFARSNLWSLFNKTLLLLWTNRNTKFKSQDGSEYPFRDLLPLVCKKDIIEKLFQHFLEGSKEQRKKVSRNIIFLGNQAITFLLNRLVFSNHREERYGLIGLISSLGENIIASVKVFFEKDLPWYAIRNMVALLAEVGSQEYYPMIEGYLVHTDIRVQRQVVAAIISFKGKHTAKRLVEALLVVDHELKQKIIMQLGAFDDEEAGLALIRLIQEQDSSIDAPKNSLIKSAIVSLRSYPYQSILAGLDSILQQETELIEKYKVNICETRNILKPKYRHRVKGQKRITDQFTLDFDPEKEADAMNKVKAFLSDLTPQFNGNEKEHATEIVFSEIIKSAKNKQFQVAELLRDRLLELNPDSLQDVIKVSELIEEEKKNPLSDNENSYWQELFSSLSDEDANQLLLCFSYESYSKDENVVQAGEIDPCLYFINSGSLKLSYTYNKREIFLKKLLPGDIVGTDPFFSSSVWTVNIAALEQCELKVLQRNVFVQNISEFERVEEVLEPYCRDSLEVDELIKMSGSERREAVRYSVNVIVNNILLDHYGRSGGKRIFQGEMLDISRGGLAFAVKLNKRENADLLLGRQIISEINLKGKEVLKCFGRIVSVNYMHDIIEEYSIHVQFYEELDQAKITQVLNLIID